MKEVILADERHPCTLILIYVTLRVPAKAVVQHHVKRQMVEGVFLVDVTGWIEKPTQLHQELLT